MNKIIDFHCDLLSYLEKCPKRTPYDIEARCAIPQLTEGRVGLQVFAIYTKTQPNSKFEGSKQLESYLELIKILPVFQDVSTLNLNGSQPTAAYAIENAASFCDEEESLDVALLRLENSFRTIGKPIYISLTWNEENRFGGGSSTTIGLKKDGKTCLDFMSNHHISVDLSHASDLLATDILNEMDRHDHDLPILASHSNCRRVQNAKRNLPDELIQELIKRKGVIGLNVYRPFVGEDPSYFTKHLHHLISLGGENSIVFGADFFALKDLNHSSHEPHISYFPEFSDASCYPRLLKNLDITPTQMQKVSYQNGLDFLRRLRH